MTASIRPTMSVPHTKVLIVEDNPGQAELVEMYLAKSGAGQFAARRADRVSSALEALGREPFDVVLLDLSLPDSDGLETVQRVAQAAGIPIVVLTGSTHEDLGTAVLRLGAQDYLPKGHFDGPMLTRSIRYAIERHQIHRALQEGEQRLRDLTEGIGKVLYILDAQTDRLLFISPAFEQLWGQTCQSAYENPDGWLDAVHPEDRQRVQAQWQDRDRGEPFEMEYRIVRLDGSVRWVWGNAVPVREQAVREQGGRERTGRVVRYVGIAEDVTERRLLEHQLRQAQKMEAVGQLAGGVAHEFNNLLQVIMGYGQLILEALDPNGQQAQDMQEVLAAGRRATHVSRQLLAFSRKESLQIERVDINSVIEGLMKMVRKLLGEMVRIELEFSKEPLVVSADPGLMEQVILNLAINARDAMPEGGTLKITTEGKSGQRGTEAVIRVTDTGCGMAPEVLDHIFEPFFTTKGPDRGTGLGLATVHGIIDQHRGRIEVESTPGAGTTFMIVLPLADRPADQPVPSADAASTPGTTEPRRKGTVLLAEDEEAVRQYGVRVLEHAGYRVLAASDGQEAVELFQAHSRDVDVVVLDAVMPRLMGRAACERIKRIRPEVPLIFCSGYDPDSNDAVKDLLLSGMPVIRKPYDRKTLIHAVEAERRARRAELAPEGI